MKFFKSIWSRLSFLLLSIVIIANLNAFVDFFLHPEIPYFDLEHIIVGGITAFISSLFLIILNIQNIKLERVIRKHESLKDDLKESEIKFQVLTEKSPDMIHLNNEKGEILFANPISEILLGYSQEELIGKQAEKLIHPAHKSLIQQDRHLLFTENKLPPLREIQILKKDGGYLPVETHTFVADIGNGKKYIGVVLRDISERIENEKKLHAIQEWSNTFDSMEEMISVHDNEFKIIRANKAFCDFLGKSREELVGKHCYEVVHGTNQQWHDCPHERTLKSLKTERNKIVDPASGISFEVTCSPLLGKGRQIIGSVHMMRNISDKKESYEVKKLYPICANCKKIRDNKNEWQAIEDYLHKEIALKFTHSICPECTQELYPELFKKISHKLCS